MEDDVSILRSDWEKVVETFQHFFESLGELKVTAEELSFSATDTGLSLHRNGTSRSFMPLHELGARWDEVAFDKPAWQVTLLADGLEYTYRVPPRLVC